MDERAVIIADRDVAYRGKMAGFLRKAGYRVEATGSADQVLNSIQDRQAPVLLLGSDFGRKIASADLVHLLKKCNRQLQIIMVSDGMTLAQARQVRVEGIFYHALKPATAGEAEELGQAVACAFEKQQGSLQVDPTPVANQKPATARAQLMNALPWMVGIAALIIGTKYISLPSAHAAQEGGSLTVWLFLAFCALIVTSQLLPIFRTKPALSRVGHRQTSKSGAPPMGK
jgi:DNA-binding NtrC family response regulator